MKLNFRNIFLLLGLIAVVVMCFTFEVSFVDLWGYITTAGYWLIAILVLWFILYMMNALTWRTILRGSGTVPVPYHLLLKWTITAFALNNVTPVGLAGGEPYKILELKEYVGTQRATSSVVLFAMMHIFAHFVFWATAIVTYVVMWLLGTMPMDTVTAILLFLMTLFCSGGIYLFCRGYKNGMVVRLIHLVSKIPGLRTWGTRFAQEHEKDLQKIDQQISDLHGQNKKSFWASFALEFLGRMMQSLEIFFIILICTPALQSSLVSPLSSLVSNLSPLVSNLSSLPSLQSSILNLQSSIINSFLILAFTSLFANLLFFLPLQLGGREGGFAMSTSQMGMTNEMGLFISILCRVRELFWTIVGLVLMKIGNGKRKEEKEQNEDKPLSKE